MSRDAALPSRPASAPLRLRPAADCCCPVQPSSVVVDVAAGGGRTVTTSADLDVSYSRDEVDVCREMVLVSLIEGSVRSSGVRAVLYKCHMCGGFVTSLEGLTRHMATHGSGTPPTTDYDQRHRLKNAVSVSSSPDPSRCNGHAESVDMVDADVAAASDADTVASSTLVDSSQQQAEDLSKPTSLRRQRPVCGRRRATTTEPVQCRRPSQRLAYVSSEMLASDQASNELGCGELASEIRAKEHLDDDVTVVIPSDAPLDYVARRDTLRSDTPAWSTRSEDGKCTEEIAHAPVKSIMGHPHVHRKARLSGSSTTMTTPTVDNGSTSSAASSSMLKTEGNLTSAQQMSLLNVNAESLQLDGLPAMFGPLALSTFVHGFGGLVAAASPFLSYYTHMPTAASLASIMAVPNAALSSPPATNSAVVDCTKLSAEQREDKSDDSPTDGAGMHVEEASSNGSGSSGWTSDPQSAGLSSPITKCSSLSRTHSRLNVVRRPIKREDACRPVVLADGRTAFRCFYCKKDFCTISDVNRHMDFHEDIRPYKCRFCNYYARTNSQLKVHMMRHQGIREYMCRLCNYKGVTQSDLNRHTKSQIHLMKARNECVQCSEGFVSPMNLEQHRQDKHPTSNSAAVHAPVVTTIAEVF